MSIRDEPLLLLLFYVWMALWLPIPMRRHFGAFVLTFHSEYSNIHLHCFHFGSIFIILHIVKIFHIPSQLFSWSRLLFYSPFVIFIAWKSYEKFRIPFIVNTRCCYYLFWYHIIVSQQFQYTSCNQMRSIIHNTSTKQFQKNHKTPWRWC